MLMAVTLVSGEALVQSRGWGEVFASCPSQRQAVGAVHAVQ